MIKSFIEAIKIYRRDIRTLKCLSIKCNDVATLVARAKTLSNFIGSEEYQEVAFSDIAEIGRLISEELSFEYKYTHPRELLEELLSISSELSSQCFTDSLESVWKVATSTIPAFHREIKLFLLES